MKKIKVLHLSVDLFNAKGNTTHDDKYFNDVERAEWFLKTWYDTWVWRDGGKNGENIEDCYFSNRDAWIQIKDGRRAEFKLEEMELNNRRIIWQEEGENQQQMIYQELLLSLLILYRIIEKR